MFQNVWQILLFSPCLLLFSGCGYTLNHRLISEVREVKGFYVPVFKNETEEIGAEVVFTNALIRELESHGEQVMGERVNGGVEIVGSVDQINRRVAVLSDPGFQGLNAFVRIPSTIAVEVRVGLQFREIGSGKVLLSRNLANSLTNSVPQNRTHDIDAPSVLPLATESVIQLTYSDIARVMMRDVYDSLVVF